MKPLLSSFFSPESCMDLITGQLPYLIFWALALSNFAIYSIEWFIVLIQRSFRLLLLLRLFWKISWGLVLIFSICSADRTGDSVPFLNTMNTRATNNCGARWYPCWLICRNFTFFSLKWINLRDTNKKTGKTDRLQFQIKFWKFLRQALCTDCWRSFIIYSR